MDDSAKKKIKRNKIAIDFESETLKEFRSKLFKSGLKPQQFFNFVADLVVTNDDDIIDIVSRAKQYYADKMQQSSEYDAELLYDLIKKNLS